MLKISGNPSKIRGITTFFYIPGLDVNLCYERINEHVGHVHYLPGYRFLLFLYRISELQYGAILRRGRVAESLRHSD